MEYQYHNIFKINSKQRSSVLRRHQSPGTDSPQEKISVVLCPAPAHPGHVEGSQQTVGLGRVEELELRLHRPVGVAGVARLELGHGVVVEIN